MRVILAVAQYANEIDRQAVEEPEQLFVGQRAFLDPVGHDAEASIATAYLSFQQQLGNQPGRGMDIEIGRQDRHQDRVRTAGVVDQFIAREPRRRIDNHVVDVVRNIDPAEIVSPQRQRANFRQRIRTVS